MDIRYSANQRDMKRYTTEELRREFFIEKVFAPDDVTGVYSHVDRVIAMGAMPIHKTLRLDQNIDCWKTLGSKFFLAGRELGVINIGGPGLVKADGQEFRLNRIEGLYVSMGTRDVEFKAEKTDNPPKFYMASAPAHRPYPTTAIPYDKAIHREVGALETSNARTINQFVHADVLETCQLAMGLTALKPGSVWNTMPVHTHERRMEVYMYFDLAGDNVVFHLMGEPTETRHIVMGNEQAVISPSWSIHSGCGTSNYSFIWAMAGENKVFDDMDAFPTASLR
ncbi:MAG: 5-dehydro-4-deoxy-D-glucuronate isomerase [Planctomycetota bacterium]|nr:5-dehydro-4-deoxy-D-glucuronate isomerase [Planctomycetota bacterium]